MSTRVVCSGVDNGRHGYRIEHELLSSEQRISALSTEKEKSETVTLLFQR
jgi:hypothetical protein